MVWSLVRHLSISNQVPGIHSSNAHSQVSTYNTMLVLLGCFPAMVRASAQLSPASGCATTFTTARHVGLPNHSTLYVVSIQPAGKHLRQTLPGFPRVAFLNHVQTPRVNS